MKKTIVLILCLAFLSLACLGSGAIQSVENDFVELVQATVTDRPTVAIPAESCAVVIADRSLHLRGGPSESAEVLTWLKRGDVVQVVSDSDPNWTRVRFEDLEGFARSIYLRGSECVK